MRLRICVKAKWPLIASLGVLAGAELVARFYFGLGDPPLSQTHPTIEYLFKPNQRVHRFGNVFATNRYGMRSDDFPPQKASPNELRVMVYGDSVVNGGALSDQSRIATSILQRRLTETQHRRVVVGNVSAGGWGPPNELAYLKQFGFLDADVVILVLSSSDYDDAPTFEPLNPQTLPTQAPISAAWEGMVRYLPRYVGRPLSGDHIPNKRDIEVSLEAEHEFLAMARAEGVKILLLQHWTASELKSGPLQGHAEIRRVAVDVPVYDDAEKLRSYVRAGKNPFRDDIHLNDDGQQALAELLLNMVR